MAQSGIVTYDVADMTDYQILYSAHYFKNMKTVPEVDWEKVAEPLAMTPEFAKMYFNSIRKYIQLSACRRARLAKKGLKDTHTFTPTCNPLALKEGDGGGEPDCDCEIPFCQGNLEELEAEVAELGRMVVQMKLKKEAAEAIADAAEADEDAEAADEEDDDEATEVGDVVKVEDKKEDVGE